MKNKSNTPRPETIQQLLFTKFLLSQMQLFPEAKPSSFSIAKKILITHDAAEIGIAAIADQIGALPNKNQRYLMDYFAPIKDKMHPSREVAGKSYCLQLNRARNNLKHGMLFPDPNQWVNVVDKIYSYLSDWCQEYLKISLDDIDNSILISNTEVKSLYDNAKKEFSNGNYQRVLELLAKAAYLLFEENSALRSLPVGVARAEDAIKLAAFGVHANDFLALQEFLPQVSKASDENVSIKWVQERFGHPGNWREDTALFCMNAFLDLALKIQNAGWIPGPIEFLAVYEHKIEAIKDGVEMWSEKWEDGFLPSSPKREVIKVLNRGESIRGMVSRHKETPLNLLGSRNILGQANIKEPEKISILSKEFGKEFLIVYVALQDVRITCVPRESDFVKEYLPDLPTIDMQLD